MKIAIFSDSFYPELSGITDTIIATGKELGRQGHSVEYFVPHYSRRAYQVVNVEQKEIDLGPNIKIHRLFSIPVKTPTMQGQALIPNPFRGFFTKEKFDVVHSHGFFGAGIDALCFSKIKSIPLVGTNHTLIESFAQFFPIGFRGPRVQKSIIKYLIWYYGLCDFVTTPSLFLIEDMKKKGLKISGRAISNPVERYFYETTKTKDVLKKEFHFSEFHVLYAGRISAEKKCEILLDAFIRFAGTHPKASLSFVGQGMLRETFEKRVAASHVSKQITFMGPFLGENKKTLYDIFHASDVFVMPSTSETQSMVVIQAMASRLPVIAARAGGPPELIGNDKGLLFEPDNVEELVRHLDTLYKDSTLQKTFGDNGNAFAQKYSITLIAQAWEETYREVTEKYKHEK
jgi:glycosyltransferase involved in cell wall biosynthesis